MVNGFVLTAKTHKGKKGITACKRANLRKEVLSEEPYSLKFSFTRDQMKSGVKEADVIFFITHMEGLVGKRDVDYTLEVF
jgi:hypothetical protein